MDVLIYTLKSVALALTTQYWVIVLLLIAVMFYGQNKKTVLMQKMIIGESLESAFELTISQIVIGIFAGVIGSIMLSYLGVVFDENSSIDLIFLISIMLMIFNPRFICFSYSGAVLGLLSIMVTLVGMKYNVKEFNALKVDVAALMTLVAVMHFIEGILTFIDGHRGVIPVFSNREDKIVGGFALKRYWALPIAMFFMIHSKSAVDATMLVPMPQWWPLIKTVTPLDIIKTSVLMLIPFYGIIGYNTVTFTKTIKKKTLTSGVNIILYSIVLFVLAQLASINIFFQILVVVFAPVAHDWMLNKERKKEMDGTPKYVSNEEGIMVLVVAPNSPAKEMGIEAGDLVVEINDKKVEDEDALSEALRESINFIWLKLKKVTGELTEVRYNRFNADKKLGIIFVPKKMPSETMVLNLGKEEESFKDLLEKFKKDDKDE